MRTLARALLARVAGMPTYLISDSESISGDEFVRRVGMRRRTLEQGGISRGHVAFVGSRRGNEFWVDLVSLWSLGATAVPVDPQLGDHRRRELIELAQPTVMLGLSLDWPGQAVAIPPAARTIAGDAEVGDSAEADDPAAILFTSGSTGKPKGLVHTHRTLLGNARATLERVDLRPADRLAMAIPTHFTSAICHFLAASLRGASLAFTDRPQLPGDLAVFADESQATCFGGAPLQIQWLSSCIRSSRLRWVFSSGDHLPIGTIDAFQAAFPETGIYVAYGLTEVGGRCCILPCELSQKKKGSVGSPIGGLSVTIIGNDGLAAKPDESGELFVAGRWLATRVLAANDEGAFPVTARGYATGDLGVMDRDGHVWLQGRTDDIFKCSGEKVSTVVIARALEELGFFEDVAVIAVEDLNHGRLPWAFVVLRIGVDMPPLSALRSALRGRLPPKHMPANFIQIDQVPRGGSGKVLRDALRALASPAGNHGPLPT